TAAATGSLERRTWSHGDSRRSGTLPARTSGARAAPLNGDRRHMRTDLVTAPTGTSLQRLAEQVRERFGDESTLHFEGETWTGAQLAGRTRRLSQGLRDAGLGVGDRVVVCMANCPEVGLTYSAVWRAGAATTPVLFLLSEDELRHVLSDSEASYIVTTPEFLPKVVASATGVATLRAIVVADAPGGVDGAALGTSIPVLDLAN